MLFFIILISSLCISGCEKIEEKPTETFCYKIELKDNGSICQTMEFPIYCEDKNEAYITELTKNIENKLYNTMYLSCYLISLKQRENQSIFENIKFTAPHLENEKIIFSFDFENKQIFNSFSSQNSLCIQLIQKEEMQTIFPFTNKTNDITLGERFYSMVNEVYEKYYNESIGDVFFEYSYITPYSKIHSNADYVVKNQHSWIVKKSELENEKIINIWIMDANRGLWYLLVIAGMLLSSLIYCFSDKIFRKKSKFNLDNKI